MSIYWRLLASGVWLLTIYYGFVTKALDASLFE